MKELIKKCVEDSIEVKRSIPGKSKDIEKAAQALINAFSSGNKVLVCGNGGSAADAMHFAGELVCTFMDRERKGLPCIALNESQPIITAWSNDFSFDTVFQRQVEALGKEGDVFFGITTSGNSTNIIKALESAKKRGMTSIALLGRSGGRMKGEADIEIIVPGKDTARIQESHILIIHILCQAIEECISGKGKDNS